MATNSNITVLQKYATKYKNVVYGWDTSHPTTIPKKCIILIYHYLHAVPLRGPLQSFALGLHDWGGQVVCVGGRMTEQGVYAVQCWPQRRGLTTGEARTMHLFLALTRQ